LPNFFEILDLSSPNTRKKFGKSQNAWTFFLSELRL
jgi:hypothetical protein